MAALAACGGEKESSADLKGARGDLVLRAARMFDGVRLVPDAAVLVRDGRIVFAGKSDGVDEDDATVVDLGNATMLPGLVDLHVHASVETAVLTGLTATRNLAAELVSVKPPETRRGRMIEVYAGPLVAVGQQAPAPGRCRFRLRGRTTLVAPTPAAVRRGVAAAESQGARLISISLGGPSRDGGGPRPPLGWVKAVVAAAHASGLQVSAHASDAEGIRLAAAAGVDELAQVPCAEPLAAPMRALAEAGTPVVGALGGEDDFRFDGDTPCAHALENARAFVRAGGKLLYGTGAGGRGGQIAVDAGELGSMRQAGLSRVAVLRAATAEAGKAAGMRGLRIGRLAPGYRADITAVPGDPTRNLAAFESPDLVVAGGSVVLDHGVVRLP